jgi:hypothetical protein
MAIDEKYQSDHLMLLVGSNPLPNAVAGRLLTRPEGEITLFHTPDSATVAKNLRIWLESKGQNVSCQVEIQDESDPVEIYGRVIYHLNSKMPVNTGLHYTGGTKAMAVHSWQAVSQWAQKNRVNSTTRSYLNPRTLEIVIDPSDPHHGESATRISVGLAVELTIEDLMKLHGLKLTESSSIPVLPATAKALAEMCSESSSYNKWKSWTISELENKCRLPKGKWKSNSKLSQEPIQPFPDESVTRAFRAEGGSVTETVPLTQAMFDNPKDFCDWLHGLWLEQHVLAEMDAIAAEAQIQDYTANIETEPINFEVDVVAIRGYQMFAISCTTSKNKGLVKSKLFEAYVRARQMGGDEARIALVCCSDDPAKVQSEMQQTLGDNGRIRVFGQSDLPDIGNKLKQWILDQSKGAR